jgi:hypothetical protein
MEVAARAQGQIEEEFLPLARGKLKKNSRCLRQSSQPVQFIEGTNG